MRFAGVLALLFAAACSGSSTPTSSPGSTRGATTDGNGGASTGDKAPPPEPGHEQAASGNNPTDTTPPTPSASPTPSDGDGGSGVPTQCPASPAVMWDTDPLLTSAVCADTRDDCVVCPQCTDGHGVMTLAYVIPPTYPRVCGCPYAADGPDMNCHPAPDAGH